MPVVSRDDSFSPLALLGVGYIGGSVALAARAAGLSGRVVGYDPDARAVAIGRERGILDEVADSPEAAVRGARLVVLAAPVASLAELARRIAPALETNALVIDVGSVKAPLVHAVQATLGARFVGCHPIAGTERQGPAAADPSIFEERTCFVTSDAPAARRFWEAIGSRVVVVDPEVHDLCMAAVSHLPHVAAYALAASLADALPALAAHPSAAAPTTSLRDTTRIAGSSPAVFRDIFLENRGPLLPLVRALEARVSAVRAALEQGDGVALGALLATGQATRERLMKGG